MKKNDRVIELLVNKYGENLLFIHIPQKDEIASGKLSTFGKSVVNKILSVNGIIFDGHSKCGFDDTDYFMNDSHPNSKGYDKLYRCVNSAIKSKWGD